MKTTASAIVEVLEQTARQAVAALEGVSEAQLNQPLDLPETNTLFALATHLVGAGEYWTLATVGKRNIPRDRPAEFRARGALPELAARYERWIVELHAVLDDLPDAALGEYIEGPMQFSAGRGEDERFTASDCLLHAVEHSALHLGHIQLTRQVLLADT